MIHPPEAISISFQTPAKEKIESNLYSFHRSWASLVLRQLAINCNDRLLHPGHGDRQIFEFSSLDSINEPDESQEYLTRIERYATRLPFNPSDLYRRTIFNTTSNTSRSTGMPSISNVLSLWPAMKLGDC